MGNKKPICIYTYVTAVCKKRSEITLFWTYHWLIEYYLNFVILHVKHAINDDWLIAPDELCIQVYTKQSIEYILQYLHEKYLNIAPKIKLFSC